MYRQNRTSYLHELMRYDSAVTSITVASKYEQTMVLEGEKVTWPKGTPMQYIIASASRDATVFSEPNQFRPGRPEEMESLSWNGKLSAAIARDYTKAPRFCPGYSISIQLTIAVC